MSDKNKYEAVIAVHPEASKDDLKALFEQIKTTISSFKGNLHHVDLLGSKPLPNLGQLKKIKSASYFHFSYESLPACVAEVERLFRIQEFVLYFHHEKLDNRQTLDHHQKYFEEILKDSNEREEERLAQIKTKKRKFTSNTGSSEAVPS